MSPPSPSMTPDEVRRLASLEASHAAHLEHCGERWELLRTDIGGMRGDVAAIKETLAQARGGWRVLAAGWATAGVIGGVVAKFLPVVMR